MHTERTQLRCSRNSVIRAHEFNEYTSFDGQIDFNSL